MKGGGDSYKKFDHSSSWAFAPLKLWYWELVGRRKINLHIFFGFLFVFVS